MNNKVEKCSNCHTKIDEGSVFYRDDCGNIYCRNCFDKCVVDEFIAEHEFCNDEDDGN